MKKVSNPEYIVTQLKQLVASDKRSEIRLNANGGNSILIVCPPLQEKAFIKSLHESLETSHYEIIDLNELLVAFMDDNKEEVEELFELLKGSINQIFKSPSDDDEIDFFSFIIQKIENSYQNKKVPVLISTGTLFGSGIESIHLMEHKLVMNAALPLIILYPATNEGEQLLFLSTRPASKYRCMIIK